MATSLLRLGRLGSLKCLRPESCRSPSRLPAAAALSTKPAGGGKKPIKKISQGHLDPIQKLFVDSIRAYNTSSQASGGLVDAGAEYQKALAEEITKLQRLYGGGDLDSFPEFKFPEPKLEEVSSK